MNIIIVCCIYNIMSIEGPKFFDIIENPVSF